MNYIRAFTGTLPSLGSYVALDFTQIESVVTGRHLVGMHQQIAPSESDGTTAINDPLFETGTLVRMRSGAVMLFQGAEEQIFMEVWAQFVLESQQQERVESWSKR